MLAMTTSVRGALIRLFFAEGTAALVALSHHDADKETVRQAVFALPEPMVKLAEERGCEVVKAEHLAPESRTVDRWVVLCWNPDKEQYIVWLYNADENYFMDGDYFLLRSYTYGDATVPDRDQRTRWACEEAAYARFFKRCFRD
jgi:hypothetical protein